MPRKKPAPSETSRTRVSKKPTTGSKRRNSSDQDSENDSDDDYDGPSTSQTKKSKRGESSVCRGKRASKSKRGSLNMKQDDDEDEEVTDDDEEEDVIDSKNDGDHQYKNNEQNGATSEEPSAGTLSCSKKPPRNKARKKVKREISPDTPLSTPSPSLTGSPSPAPSVKSENTAKKSRKNCGSSLANNSESTSVKNHSRSAAPKKKKQPAEDETAEEKKLRIRAERKARRIEEAKQRPKLTIAQKLEKLKKKKERRERRKEREKEESMRQKYGQRKIKAESSKWNFGPISSINQRRREEMMAYFPKANFSREDGVPKVMNNFRRATVKYNMDVLNPFITCGVCNGYIVDATTIIDCMHTFCKSCLLTYFQSENNTCPTCGTFIHGSHPTHYVTYDRAVNELVNQFVPKMENNELEARKQFLRDCREAIGIDTAAEDRERKERLERERVTGTNRCYALERPRLSHHRDDCQVTVNLLPGTANLPLITRPFVRCSEMTTMNTLKKFIALQIWDDQSRYSDLDMFCDGQLMGKDFSIRFVWMMKRRGQPKSEPLAVRYHMTRT